MTLEERWKWATETPSDIAEHIPTLLRYGLQCNHVTEFGVRAGVSTTAWIKAGVKQLVCYDIQSYNSISELSALSEQEGVNFRFILEDTRMAKIEPTDLLFIDAFHNYSAVQAELNNNHIAVKKFIILHDTVLFGQVGEDGSAGLKTGVIDFLLTNTNWRIKEHFQNCNGLTVLERA